jgi:AraC family transcriptional regulator of adaptative response/methylated-DNA-[protein]-cysteine methyltransferase
MVNEDLLWDAVTRRDTAWNGVFVYAVPSTKIYCRPTCPSRRPARDGVRFFPAPASAAAEGFRACLRCHPDADIEIPPQIERVRRACLLLARYTEESWPLARLAKAVGGSPHYLLRSFKQTLGITPREYADACRVGCLKSGLRAGESVASATYGAGFSSGSRVYERSASTLGMTPATYARGGAGEDVEYVIVPSPLGRLLVATTPRGLCSVTLGDSDQALEAVLKKEFPGARVAAGDPRLAGWVEQIVSSLDPGAPDVRLPMDVRATAFQRQVWRELQDIPRGETRTYLEVARRIGRPSASRAVARACATNPLAVVVPCHRVIQHDGGLGGYHWGTGRKRALLDSERSG